MASTTQASRTAALTHQGSSAATGTTRRRGVAVAAAAAVPRTPSNLLQGCSRKLAFHRNPTRLAASKSKQDLDSHIHLDLYQVLGLPGAAASSDEIRSSYKYLAKHAHPDISGDENSSAFALINKAYEVLSDPSAKLMYDSGRSLFGEHSAFGDFTGEPLSHNAQPGHPSASFVDENTCIGCRACVHEAPNTFMIDEQYGKARVETQWADRDESIAVARELCPVDCIHLVASEDLPVLEFIQRSMPARHMIINSDQTCSGGARGMEESPFVAAERFEAKKAKLLEDAEARAHAAQKMKEAMESIRRTGVIPGSWWRRGRRGDANADQQQPVNGPCCPLIIHPGGRLLLPAPPPSSPNEHRPGV